MSKFKVGDKVEIKIGLKEGQRGKKANVTRVMAMMCGKSATVVRIDNEGDIILDINPLYAWDTDWINHRREFIVIRRDGAKTIAELRHDREVIKSGTAICNASDTFDFGTGAKLAFDRLMGREEPKPEPKPAHKFKVGDRVQFGNRPVFGNVRDVRGSMVEIESENGEFLVASSKNFSYAPAPEPQKYYTGKVVCISGEYGVGRIFTVKDGFFVERQYNCPWRPYKSVDDMNDRFLFGKFAEAKE